MKSRVVRIGVVAALVFGVAQLVPYGRAHESPPTKAEPTWDSPETRELFFRVCRDCHSNETTWPWYSSVAPMSWLVQYDVGEGRSHFNVSRWGEGKQDGDEAAEELREGEMPPWFYLPLHPEAELSPDERQRFISGLEKTFGTEDDEEGDHGEHEHED